MRGAHNLLQREGRVGGIIPAYAGSTDSRGLETRLFRDHPRVCGEHQTAASSVQRDDGSSPRMRGALHTLLLLLRYQRIIPAYAGSTMTPKISTSKARDHPRVCGEHGVLGSRRP